MVINVFETVFKRNTFLFFPKRYAIFAKLIIPVEEFNYTI